MKRGARRVVWIIAAAAAVVMLIWMWRWGSAKQMEREFLNKIQFETHHGLISDLATEYAGQARVYHHEAALPTADLAEQITPAGARYTVVAKQFSRENDAKRLVERLKKKKYDAYLQYTNTEKGVPQFVVGVGAFDNATEAEKIRQQLSESERIREAQVQVHPQ